MALGATRARCQASVLRSPEADDALITYGLAGDPMLIDLNSGKVIDRMPYPKQYRLLRPG
jgi:hypothetical protein